MKQYRRLLILWAAATLPAAAFVSQRLPLDPPDDLEVRWFFDRPASPRYPQGIFNVREKAIRYHLGAEAWSATNHTAELNAVRAAFDQWSSIPGSMIRFEEAELLPEPVDLDPQDGKNLVYWARESTLIYGGTIDLGSRVALTLGTFGFDGSIQEMDIAFNGVRYGWFTDINNTINRQQFVEGTALHEIGHFLGLSHSPSGGSSMLAIATGGINSRLLLSDEEIAFARSRYPAPQTEEILGEIKGSVTAAGSANPGPVHGAVVVAESAAGILISATLTEADGFYRLPGLPPGDYGVRVTPLDPSNAPRFLSRAEEFESRFTGAETAFLPTENQTVSVTAGSIRNLDFIVSSGEPAFRITRIRNATASPGLPHESLRTVAAIPTGTFGQYVGVMGAALPVSNATLSITGDDLTVGAPRYVPSAVAGMNLILVPVDVPPTATPGLRSFILRHQDQIAYANGYFEVLPPEPDGNFDGLNDAFQRHYFDPFTAPEAGPDSDPDLDLYPNWREARDNTDPTNAGSFFYEIDRLILREDGVTIQWQSVAGKRYQVFRKPVLQAASWEAVGNPVTATGPSQEFTDPLMPPEMRFYIIQALP